MRSMSLGKAPRGDKEFKGAGVLEIVEDHAGDAYRAVYTVKFAGAVYVLHPFQKKSKRDIATPKSDIDLVKRRLRAAREHYAAKYSGDLLTNG